MVKIYTAEESTFEVGVRTWECPDCGFSYDAQHTIDGGEDHGKYSCPECELVALQNLDAHPSQETEDRARNAGD